MKHYILMADIVDSSKKNQAELMRSFKLLVDDINEIYQMDILSPLTITLGDEFQCVLKNLKTAIKIIIAIEEAIIENEFDFRLRYILNQGEIETPINNKIAYEMLGQGLTDARKALNSSKNEKNRFIVTIDHPLQEQLLANAFIILENIIEKWNLKRDYKIVSNFIKYGDYKTVSQNLHKTRSQIWKREKTLNIEGYNSTKNILELTPEIV